MEPSGTLTQGGDKAGDPGVPGESRNEASITGAKPATSAPAAKSETLEPEAGQADPRKSWVTRGA